MKAMALLALMLLAVIGLGQAPDKKRVDAIWDLALDRMERQQDVWFGDGEFPICIQILRFEYDLYPADYEIATNLGWMLENVQQWSDAEAVYTSYLHGNPSDPDRALPLAEYWFLRKQYAKIPPVLAPVLSNRSHPNNFRILAHTYDRLGKLQQSVDMWKRYIALAPSDGAAKTNLARVQKKLQGSAGH